MNWSTARRREYAAYIASPAWEAKRQRALRTQGDTCRACGTPGPGLHVHHHTYERFRAEHDSDLIVLCQPCHQTIHRLHKQQLRKNRGASLTEVTFAYLRTTNPDAAPPRAPRKPKTPPPPKPARTDGKRVISLNRADRKRRSIGKSMTRKAVEERAAKTRALRKRLGL